MATIRRNIINSQQARDQYIRGITLLKREFIGPTTAQFGIPGPALRVSTYDLFVVWHHFAMYTYTPRTQMDRNAAHRGPAFLPWHRFMLILLERHLQRVLNDQNFGLPYWDWAADGDLPLNQQLGSPVWANNCLGGQGTPVTTGPFAFNAADANSWRVRIVEVSTGRLNSVDRGLNRQLARPELGLPPPSLPTKAEAAAAVNLNTFDAADWSTTSSGFRNRLEGWQPRQPYSGLHNRVHVWVGGDMGPASSPNDPVFYLNHCNVDRLWEAWLNSNGRTYLPDQTAPTALRHHRIDDQLYSLLAPARTPRQMLDVSTIYTYDTLVP
ncbi:MAG: tyrosinase family protein [Dehalococcoidia bacterium]|nr:tyrosinase family protein [Dehalococcoidia bacterium]